MMWLVLAVLGQAAWPAVVPVQAGECRVFLVPGAFGASGGGGAEWFIAADDYFKEQSEWLRARGCLVKKGEFPPDATIEERALILKDQAGRFRDGKPLALLAHSQGALDARFALKTLGLEGVVSVVSIGAPHVGTPAAAWVVRARENRSAVYWLFRLLGDYDFDALRFMKELTPEFLLKHAERFAAVPGVRYASAKGVCRTACHRVLSFAAWWMGQTDEPGDGLVPEKSQGFGEDIGVFDLDHLQQVGVDEAKKSERMRFFEAAGPRLLPVVTQSIKPLPR